MSIAGNALDTPDIPPGRARVGTAKWKIAVAIGLVIVLLGIISTVLWNYYSTQEKLKNIVMAGFESHLAQRAAAISYYFMERFGDLDDIAESKEVENYFANKALGMSLEYGLRMSLFQISSLFGELITKKTIAGAPVYRQIVMFDGENEILAMASSPAEDVMDLHPTEDHHYNDSRPRRMIRLETGAGSGLVLRRPVLFKNRREGTLLMRLNMEALYQALIAMDMGRAKDICFLSIVENGDCRPLTPIHNPRLEAYLRQTGCRTRQAVTLANGEEDSSLDDMLVINMSVEGTPLLYSSVFSGNSVFGSTPPKTIVLVWGGLALIVYVGMVLLFWAGHRNVLLQTRIAEKERRKAEVEERNEQLQTEIATRMQTEEALRISEEKYRHLIENAREIIFTTDSRGLFTYVNPSSTSLTGFAPEELLGRHFTDIVQRDSQTEARRFYLNQITGETEATYKEFPIINHDGELRWLGLNVQLEQVVGQAATFRAVGRDITDLKKTRDLLQESYDKMEARVKQRTRELYEVNDRLAAEVMERKQAQQALQEQLAFLQRLIDTISMPIFFKDLSGEYLGCNQAFEKYLGLPRDLIIGRFSEDLADHEPVAVYRGSGYVPNALQGVQEYEARVRRPDGRIQNLFVNKAVYFDSELNPAGHVWALMDMTERKELEGKLLQSQKLEAIGSLAAGIAHEINTPIQFIGDNTRFLLESYQDFQKLLGAHEALLEVLAAAGAYPEHTAAVAAARETLDVEYLMEEVPLAIEQSLDGVEHVANIVRSMKEFSHPGTERKTEADINRAIENTITVARNEWKYRADIVRDLAPDLPMVPCLLGELNQVMLNLIVNAVHAISAALGEDAEAKGTITISTRLNGPHVEIRVADNGTGIPEAVRDRIFDPFFTTKEVGQGTGQGLAVSRSVIVDKHGGQLTFETEIGKGTTFFIRLPWQNTEENDEEPQEP